jgi:hypothetical protein
MKLLTVLFSIFLIDTALACPGCIGSNPKDQYLVYILGGFILLTYIPFFFLFRMIKKHHNFRNDVERLALEGEGAATTTK